MNRKAGEATPATPTWFRIQSHNGCNELSGCIGRTPSLGPSFRPAAVIRGIVLAIKHFRPGATSERGRGQGVFMSWTISTADSARR